MTHCEGCRWKSRPCVPGEGNKDAEIILVGRNPGSTEAELGRPFIGPSGQLLDATLVEAGLEREEVFLTNAVLCQHVDDEGYDTDPPSEAFQICRDRLREEIKSINPKIVVALGGDAAQIIIQTDRKISDIQGAMMYVPDLGKYVIPTYHPAYIIRGAIGAFDDLLAVVKRARRIAQGVVPLPSPNEQYDIEYIVSAQEAGEALANLILSGAGTFALDTETKWLKDPDYEMLLVQISDGKKAWVFESDRLMNDPNYSLFRGLLEDPRKRWIFHNAEFDLRQLWHNWHVRPPQIEDTMSLALCLTERGEGVGLKRLAREYLSVGDYEDDLHEYVRGKNTPMDAAPREVLVKYAGLDAINTHRLFYTLDKTVQEEGNHQLYDLILRPIQATFADMAYHGTRVDLNYVEELRSEYYPLRDAAALKMQEYAFSEGFRASNYIKKPKSEYLNPGSPKQLIGFFNDTLGIRTNTTDAEFMEQHEDLEFVKLLMEYRTIDKMLGTYVDGIADDVGPDGRVHPDFMLFGAKTGRLAIKNPPLQTLPREGTLEDRFKSIKRLFIPSDEYTFVHADYNQLEFRTIWHITKDKALGEALMSEDFHRAVAAHVFKKPYDQVTKEDRNRGKFVSFGIAYGRQAWSIAKGEMQCSVAEAQLYIDNFFERFPDYAKWWSKVRDDAVETGLLETQFGRRRRWPLITAEMEDHIRNQACNFPPQSMANDINLLGLIRLNNSLRERDLGFPLFTVHDSIEFEVRTSRLQEGLQLIEETLTQPFKGISETCATFSIDLEYGPSMGDCH